LSLFIRWPLSARGHYVELRTRISTDCALNLPARRAP